MTKNDETVKFRLLQKDGQFDDFDVIYEGVALNGESIEAEHPLRNAEPNELSSMIGMLSILGWECIKQY